VIAVVMAGGEGSRLRPLTIGRPKPMVPVLDKPCIEHIFELLKMHGITEVVVTLHYMGGVIQDYFGDGTDFGMKIHYAVEELPLGTAGSVKNAQHLLNETFLVISGDALTDINLTQVLDYHRQKRARATLVLVRVANPLEYGVVITDSQGAIQRFMEKPSWGEVFSDTVNTGIYVLEPETLDYLPANVSKDFSSDLFPMMLDKGDPMFGYIASGYWCDVGNLSEYMRASFEFLQGKVKLPMPGVRRPTGVYARDDVEIDPDARTYGPVFLGQGSRIRGRAVIHGPTIIGDYTTIGDGATVDRSIIWGNCFIGDTATINGTIVARQCSIKRGAVVLEGCVIGDQSTVGEGAIVRSDVKIWPNKEVEDQATVSSSLIWGARGRRSLFAGHAAVSGLANIELTPEYAAKVGAAYGSILERGTMVTMNRDLSRASRMIKRAVMSGLTSAGVGVLDTTNLPLPMARFETQVMRAAGGIHVRISPADSRVVDIKLLDRSGLDISKNVERKIVNSFFREDVRRVSLEQIGPMMASSEYTGQALDRYRSAYLDEVNASVVAAANFKLVIDYSNGLVAPVGQDVLRRLGCNPVTMNALMAEPVARSAADIEASRRNLAAITSAVKADVGILINYSGQRMTIVDNKGRVLPNWVALAVFTTLALKAVPGGQVAVPQTAPHMIRALAQQTGGSVKELRPDPPTLQAATADRSFLMVGDGNGAYAFPRIPSSFDALFATAKLLEYLAVTGSRLSDLVENLPPFFIRVVDVNCAWEHKGRVMRRLHEELGTAVATSDQGVQIDLGEDHVVIVPDSDKPTFHVHAESSSAEHAQSLAHRYADMVQSFQAS